MKAYIIEIYDDNLNTRLKAVKAETGKTYAYLMRKGVKMYLQKLEEEKNATEEQQNENTTQNETICW